MFGKFAPSNNAWIKWVLSVYIKDAGWWTYNPTQGASRYWRNICNTKELLKQYYTDVDIQYMETYSVKDVYLQELYYLIYIFVIKSLLKGSWKFVMFELGI